MKILDLISDGNDEKFTLNAYIKLQLNAAKIIGIIWLAMLFKVIVLNQSLSSFELNLESSVRSAFFIILSVAALGKMVDRAGEEVFTKSTTSTTSETTIKESNHEKVNDVPAAAPVSPIE